MDRHNVDRRAGAAEEGRLDACRSGTTAREDKLVLSLSLGYLNHLERYNARGPRCCFVSTCPSNK
jgi:hypothetical protein